MSPAFWRGKSVLITGHTGFKGSWLSIWLLMLGARVTGFALKPPTRPSLFQLAGLQRAMKSISGDVRDLRALQATFRRSKPEIVFHLAAQSLVRLSYQDPVGTYATNVTGTVNVLEALRDAESVHAAVMVTSDKCYENRERRAGYRENEAMGGHDPYSSSKGCAELVVAAYRRSFFARAGVAVASARAGNVIGGGDWGKDRLVPDALGAFGAGRVLVLRNPSAVRPWQHVLDPLNAYLLLAERLCDGGAAYAGAWNFGPENRDEKPVSWVATQLARRWGDGAKWQAEKAAQAHEAGILRLDCSKARKSLRWRPRLKLGIALDWVVEWARRRSAGEQAKRLTQEQIARFQSGLTR